VQLELLRRLLEHGEDPARGADCGHRRHGWPPPRRGGGECEGLGCFGAVWASRESCFETTTSRDGIRCAAVEGVVRKYRDAARGATEIGSDWDRRSTCPLG
jgi:hypothetical protein